MKIMKFVEEQLAIYKQKELEEQKRKEEEDKKAREAARKNLIETHIGYLRDYKVLAQYKTKITVEQDNNFRKIITDLGGKVTHKKNITNAILLIARILEKDCIVKMARKCADLGMTALIEVRSKKDLEKLSAVAETVCNDRIVCGVNARDLKGFQQEGLIPYDTG